MIKQASQAPSPRKFSESDMQATMEEMLNERRRCADRVFSDCTANERRDRGGNHRRARVARARGRRIDVSTIPSTWTARNQPRR